MSHEDTQGEPQTLGAFLRDHRKQKGASLTDVSETTKISLPVLKAIEDDDHESMPAEAFCRGFYSMYADFLELDRNEILGRYTEHCGLIKKAISKQAQPPVKKSQIFNNFAEPSAISPGISTTFFTVLSLFLIIGLCYYFKWNPINYINTMLTQPPTTIEQQPQPVLNTPVMPADNAVVKDVVPDDIAIKAIAEDETETISLETEQLILPPTPDPADKKIEQVPETSSIQETTVAPYDLEMTFNNSGTLKVTLDDGFVLEKYFTAGETMQWEVKKKIILDMPEKISGNLRLNGIEIPLPQEENGRRMLSLPEDLLD